MKIREILELMNRTNNQPPMLPDQALAEIVKVVKAEKNKLPLELQNCYMEIYRKEQNLTPLLNSVRNFALEEIIKKIKE